MSLRRTGIARKSELRRVKPMLRSKRERKARVTRTITRQRDTGPSAATRRLVVDRAGGGCELCGAGLVDSDGALVASHSVHHRRPRAMGGSSDPATNSPANLLLLCGTGTTGCHGRVESHRGLAYRMGWLVRMGQNPATTPTTVHGFGDHDHPWVLLTADGTYTAAGGDT